MRNVKKQHLPTKVCAACGRPFTWRRKWERVWSEVRYCSDKCREHVKRTRAADCGSPGESVK
ncbi:MAG: DUF2256 domain-containing protein [Pyrinomonadaceae bacterium]|nr:DUF2256 domain-containing protein [Pyrinomonadaceae bacterium]